MMCMCANKSCFFANIVHIYIYIYIEIYINLYFNKYKSWLHMLISSIHLIIISSPLLHAMPSSAPYPLRQQRSDEKTLGHFAADAFQQSLEAIPRQIFVRGKGGIPHEWMQYNNKRGMYIFMYICMFICMYDCK